MQPKYPIFIPSKGRYQYDRRLTARFLDSINVPYRLVVEPQEYKLYLNEVKDKKKLLVLDMSYKDKYETLDSKNQFRGVGPGACRNFLWEYSISEGHKYHWTLDDNIRCFRRLNRNIKVKISDGAIFRAMEDFTERYKNCYMSGPQYDSFVIQRKKQKPFVTNTRIYSCNLIKNDIPFRWRGRYNEDTILSIDIMKAGYCTILFNAFLQDKTTTQKIKGGNTDEFYDLHNRKSNRDYSDTGTIAKSQMLADVHPDVSKVVWMFNRVHHKVNYSVFKNKLIRDENYIPMSRVNNYGMNLRSVKRKK